MANQALGMIETRGLIALVEATDAMLKSANVELVGPMTQVGNAMVTVCVTGDVAAVKAAVESGKTAARARRSRFDQRHCASAQRHGGCSPESEIALRREFIRSTFSVPAKC